jgi:hypothetical protein
VTLLPAQDVDVLDGGRIGREKERHGAAGRTVESAGEPQDGQRAQETARVDFEVGFHRR